MDDLSKVLENAARFAAQKGIARFTRYLDPAQVHEARRYASEYGVSFSSWGGYDRAERIIGCFSPYGDTVSKEDFPVVCLQASIPVKFCHVTHRDMLGAFMALGLTRDSIGDIIIVSDAVYLFLVEQTAEFVASSMTSAGKASLHFSVMETVPDIPEPEGKTFSSVVSSLRLDAVLAAAYHLSRSEAAAFIRAGDVKVDHLPENRTDYLLKENVLLSLKGHGRVRFISINGTTRKQRIGINLFRYE